MLSTVNASNAPLAAILGLEGLKLTKEEIAFFKECNPLGFILFKRNCEDPAQVKALTASLQDLLGREVPILIDQEGGRVQRLGPPHWPKYPPAETFGKAFEKDFKEGLNALYDSHVAMARDLVELGVNVDCTPVMDVLTDKTHDVIGDRAFSKDPEIVSILSAKVCQAMLDEGVVPIIKHIPGHGRATADSHDELPVVDASLEELKKTDFVPFKEVQVKPLSEAVWAMTAHIIYKKIDERAPGSCSRRVIYDIIRDHIGFQGFLVSDDVGMSALADYGTMGQRAEKAIRAGCDIVLHCNGKMDEMKSVASDVGTMRENSVERYNHSVKWIGRNKQKHAA